MKVQAGLDRSSSPCPTHGCRRQRRYACRAGQARRLACASAPTPHQATDTVGPVRLPRGAQPRPLDRSAATGTGSLACIDCSKPTANPLACSESSACHSFSPPAAPPCALDLAAALPSVPAPPQPVTNVYHGDRGRGRLPVAGRGLRAGGARVDAPRRTSAPAPTSRGCRSAKASPSNSRNCAARSRPATTACRSAKAASSRCGSSRRRSSRCWSGCPRSRRRRCGGRCSIPTPITPTARPPWIGMCRRRMGGSWRSTLSEGGSEQGTLHFFEVDTGRKLADEIPRVQYPTGGGSAAWTADGSGIFYTRYPHQGERPEADLNFYQQVWFHRLGTPVAEDQYAIGKDFPRIAEIELEASEDGRWIAGHGGQRRRRRFRPLPARRRGRVAAADAVRGRRQAGEVWPRRRALPALAQGCAPRDRCCACRWTRPSWPRPLWPCPESRGVMQEFAPGRPRPVCRQPAGRPVRTALLPARQATAAPRFPSCPVSSVAGLRILARRRPGVWQRQLPGALCLVHLRPGRQRGRAAPRLP